MFSYYYNYIFFFFDYQILVVICFFFFLLFTILAEKGNMSQMLQELSIEARSKLSRNLTIRENLIKELSLFLIRSISKMRKIIISSASIMCVLIIHNQLAAKKLSGTCLEIQLKYFLENGAKRSQYLSLLGAKRISFALTSNINVTRNVSKLKIL